MPLLTPQQCAILALVAREGLSHREIGRRLGISPSTVDARLSEVYRVLGVSNQGYAAAYWEREYGAGRHRRQVSRVLWQALRELEEMGAES